MFYNFNKPASVPGAGLFSRGLIIKTESVFTAIKEINEILSLTNEPDKLVNTALDTFSQILDIECCWVQTINDREENELSLAADRGFSDDMRAEIAAMGLNSGFAGEIIGAGGKITIPDLNNDGVYGLDSFRAAGYRWLVAVPLMTYRAYGLLGTASKNKRLLDKDTAGLVSVIGGLIANALSKALFTREAPRRSKLPDIVALPEKTPAIADTKTEMAPVTLAADVTPDNSDPPPTSPPKEETSETKEETVKPPPKTTSKRTDPAFHAHARKMEHFRRTHK